MLTIKPTNLRRKNIVHFNVYVQITALSQYNPLIYYISNIISEVYSYFEI